MTDRDDALRAAASPRVERTALGPHLKKSVYAALGRKLRAGTEHQIPYWIVPLAEVWYRRMQAGELDAEKGRSVIAEAVAAPLRALGIDAARLSDRELGDYVLPLASALLHTAHHARAADANRGEG